MMTDGFVPPKSRSKQRRKGAQSKKRSVRSRGHAHDGAGHAFAEFTDWYGPTRLDDSSGWGIQDHVDLLQGFVTFWRKNVQAAEQGEDMEKLGDFLDKLCTEEEKWAWGAQDNARWNEAANDEGWAAPVQANWGNEEQGGWTGGDNGGWGTMDWIGREDPWAIGDRNHQEWVVAADGAGERQSDKTARVSGSGSCDGRSDGDLSSFVNNVARKERASPSRQRSLQQFYLMSTQQKVEKIEEVVDFLRRHR